MSGMDEGRKTKDEGIGSQEDYRLQGKTPVEDDMDRYLTNKASAFRYPPTPDVASAVRNRLAEGAYRDGGRIKGSRQQPRQAWVAMTLTAVMVLGALMVVPDVRAFVGNIYIGVVRIIQGNPDNPAPDVPTATPVAPWNPRLAGEIDLGTLIAQRHKVSLPTYPTDLGLPDHVYYQSLNYDLVLYVWLDPERADKPTMALYQIGARMPITKELAHDTTYLDILIGDAKGAWIDGQYSMELAYLDNAGNKNTSTREVVPGKTLVWYDKDSGFTYKLVGDMTMEQAIHMGVSLQPLAVPPTPYPTSTPVSPASRLDLVGETSLYELAQRSGFRIKIPAVPEMPELVQPDKVYLQGSAGLPDTAQVVIMAWFVPGRNDDIRMVLTQGMSDVTSNFDTTTGAVSATVNGNQARWVLAPQVVYVNGPGGAPTLAERSLVTGSHALIWQEDGFYYRLETTLSMSEAIQIAESLR